jgi:hypothetical protein
VWVAALNKSLFAKKIKYPKYDDENTEVVLTVSINGTEKGELVRYLKE